MGSLRQHPIAQVTRRQQFGVRNDPELQDEEEQTGGKKKGKGKGRGKGRGKGKGKGRGKTQKGKKKQQAKQKKVTGKGKQDGTDGKEKAAKPRGGGSRKKPEDGDILEKEEETPDAPPKPSEESSARTQDLPDGETQTGNESQSRPAKAKRVQETNAPKAKKPKINEARPKTSLPSVEANGATGSSKKVEADETNLGKKTRKRTRQPAKTAEAVAGAGLVGERQKASGEEKVGVPAGNGTGGSNDGMDGNEKGEVSRKCKRDSAPGTEKTNQTWARRRRPKTSQGALKWDTLRHVFLSEIKPVLAATSAPCSMHEDQFAKTKK